jgi:hypothetical protein
MDRAPGRHQSGPATDHEGGGCRPIGARASESASDGARGGGTDFDGYLTARAASPSGLLTPEQPGGQAPGAGAASKAASL